VCKWEKGGWEYEWMGGFGSAVLTAP